MIFVKGKFDKIFDYMTDFQKSIIEGIPDELPAPKPFDPRAAGSQAF